MRDARPHHPEEQHRWLKIAARRACWTLERVQGYHPVPLIVRDAMDWAI